MKISQARSSSPIETGTDMITIYLLIMWGREREIRVG
jgi:hypothetical protein